MTREFRAHECRVCGTIVEVLYRGRGDLTCCGLPLRFSGESSGPSSAPLDLTEIRINGKSCWQFFMPEAQKYVRLPKLGKA